MNKQKGFTLIELIIAIGGIAAIVAVVTSVTVVWHFIAKYW